MRPIFTIHAGEYLVGAKIEKALKEFHVWIPSKDTGIDLLVTNKKNTKTASLQVKFSKNFNVTHGKKIFQKDIKANGWWTLNRVKIKNSKADFWVFVLYGFENKNHDFVIIKRTDLLPIFKGLKRTGKTIHCYITISNKYKTAFETRDLADKEKQLIFNNKYND